MLLAAVAMATEDHSGGGGGGGGGGGPWKMVTASQVADIVQAGCKKVSCV